MSRARKLENALRKLVELLKFGRDKEFEGVTIDYDEWEQDVLKAIEEAEALL